MASTIKLVNEIAVTLFLILLMVGTAYAQSTKPSPPNFTIQIPNNSTIQLVIENQAFTSSSSVNSLIYYNKVKDHYSDRWIIDKNYQLQSDSKTTTIEIDLVPFGYFTILNNSTILDFQVQAVTGYYAITQKPGHMPGALINFTSPDGYTEITFNDSESSDWSNTVTVDLNDKITLSPTQIPTDTPTSTPTSTPASTNSPTQTPNQDNSQNTGFLSTPEFPIVIAIVAIVAVGAIVGIVLRRRR